MDKEALQGWLIAAVIGLVICATGWYGAARNSTDSASSSLSTESSDSTSTSTDEYQQALSEANDNIEQVNVCIDDSYDSFDNGDFEDGMDTLGDCQADTVSEP